MRQFPSFSDSSLSSNRTFSNNNTNNSNLGSTFHTNVSISTHANLNIITDYEQCRGSCFISPYDAFQGLNSFINKTRTYQGWTTGTKDTFSSILPLIQHTEPFISPHKWNYNDLQKSLGWINLDTRREGFKYTVLKYLMMLFHNIANNKGCSPADIGKELGQRVLNRNINFAKGLC